MTNLEQLARKVKYEIAKRVSEKSLLAFLKDFAWPVLQPGNPFSGNWHVDAICQHLEAINSGEIKKLVISMPFRCLKSTIVSQTFPAWSWISKPHIQFLTASYARDLAIRDAVESRRIVESPEYQAAWGDRFKIVSDQNVKSRYQNNFGGQRFITSTDSAATGFGGNVRIIDDPLSAKDSDSELARTTCVEWWKSTIATRGNNPATDAVIVVHQRTHVNDLTGYLLAEETGWEHLILPMRYEKILTKTTSLGFVDPRKEDGELLHPARLPEKTVSDLEKSLGVYHTESQLQQSPSQRGGTIFERKFWNFYETLPAGLSSPYISVDCAFKDLETSDYVAIQVWAKSGSSRYLLHRVKAKLSFSKTVLALESVIALYPNYQAILVESAANGFAVIDTITKKYRSVIGIKPDGGKTARAYACSPELEAGNLFLPHPTIHPDIEVFLNEVTTFPGSKNDDEVDAMSQALNYIRAHESGIGIFEYYKEKAKVG